jgi:hypothetical protein
MFSDVRDDRVWHTRSSNFHTLFPYDRNRSETEVTQQMTYATAVSISR